MKYLKLILVSGLLLSILKAEDNSSWYEKGKSYTSDLVDKGLTVDKNSTWYKTGKEYGNTISTYTTKYWKMSVAYITDLYNRLFKDLDKTGLQIIKKDNQINIIAPGYIAFDTNKADIKYKFEPILRDIAKSLLEYNQVTIKIKGYTDNTGSSKYNLKLSENRAKSVYKALSLLGIKRSKMSYEGLSASNPIASNETPEGRQKNRRVDMEIVFANKE
jgi:outer membrane protein OmpA-like peptidoglycan-associated protein